MMNLRNARIRGERCRRFAQSANSLISLQAGCFDLSIGVRQSRAGQNLNVIPAFAAIGGRLFTT
jgi:hypothetical protein